MSLLHLSPHISELKWGVITVEGIGRCKDAKLWPGGGREWDWSETGTHHVPGIQPEDVDELLAQGATEIILSRGMLLALQTSDQAKELLTIRKIPFHIHETRQAAILYNKLAGNGIAVGGLFHSTC